MKPTANMIKKAETLILAMTYVKTLEPRIRAIQTKILSENHYRVYIHDRKNGGVNLEHTERAIAEIGQYVRDPKNDYLMHDKDFADYYAKCYVIYKQEGYNDLEYEQCPLLIAENLELKAKREFIDAMQPFTHITWEEATYSLESLKQLVDLSLRYVVPYIKKNADQIMKEVRARAGA